MITVDQDDLQTVDVYGRILGKVYCEGGVINEMLLTNGHANILTDYCNTSEFSGELWAQKYGCNSPEVKTAEIPVAAPIVTPKDTPKTSSDDFPKDSSKEKCDSSYPTVCIPPYPPDLNCKDISYKKFIVLQPDPHRFDGDNDGIGCES